MPREFLKCAHELSSLSYNTEVGILLLVSFSEEQPDVHMQDTASADGTTAGRLGHGCHATATPPLTRQRGSESAKVACPLSSYSSYSKECSAVATHVKIKVQLN